MDIIRNTVRDVPDFPKKGIIFKDITPVLRDARAFRTAIDEIALAFSRKRIDAVLGIEARGFILGAPVAYRLGIGFIPARKKGKLPWKCMTETYDLEYGTDSIQMHEDAVRKGQNILIVDDLLATGGTAAAACRLVEQAGGKVVACAFIVELAFLKGREKLGGREVFSIVKYDAE
jgi:adenine phosphoribosyltransferase